MTDAVYIITPKEVLYDFEEPLMYTFELDGELYFGYMSDHDELLFIKTTQEDVEALKRNEIPILDFLSQTEVWATTRVPGTQNQWFEADLLENGMGDIDEQHKPRPGVKLRP